MVLRCSPTFVMAESSVMTTSNSCSSVSASPGAEMVNPDSVSAVPSYGLEALLALIWTGCGLTFSVPSTNTNPWVGFWALTL